MGGLLSFYLSIQLMNSLLQPSPQPGQESRIFKKGPGPGGNQLFSLPVILAFRTTVRYNIKQLVVLNYMDACRVGNKQ